MRNIIYLLAFSMGILISCEKESPFYDEINHDSTTQSEHSSLIFNPIDMVHPTILESDWWNTLSITEQEFIAVELTGQNQQITFEDLKTSRRENLRVWNKTERAGTVSPGYPIPNPEGDVMLTTQAEVDDFGAMGYDHILGSLRINDFVSIEKICDLSPLSDLKSVGSFCFISSVTCANDLNGLHNLKTVGLIGPMGAFSVVGENLTDISALNNLRKITGSLNILLNTNLRNINTFYRIKKIGPGQTPSEIYSNWVLSIRRNDNLRNMDGLSNLRQVAGRVLITDNDQLRNINDLTKLKEIGNFAGDIFPNKNLELLNNPNLRNLDGLAKLRYVGGSLLINENASLRNLDGLSDLSSIGENLEVINNLALNRFCGLYNMITTGIPGTVTITGNATNPTVADIIADGPCG